MPASMPGTPSDIVGLPTPGDGDEFLDVGTSSTSEYCLGHVKGRAQTAATSIGVIVAVGAITAVVTVGVIAGIRHFSGPSSTTTTLYVEESVGNHPSGSADGSDAAVSDVQASYASVEEARRRAQEVCQDDDQTPACEEAGYAAVEELARHMRHVCREDAESVACEEADDESSYALIMHLLLNPERRCRNAAERQFASWIRIEARGEVLLTAAKSGASAFEKFAEEYASWRADVNRELETALWWISECADLVDSDQMTNIKRMLETTQDVVSQISRLCLERFQFWCHTA